MRSGAGLESPLAATEPPAAEHAALALLVLDDERRCVQATLSACRLLGVARDAAVGRALEDLLAPGMTARLENVWRAFRDGGGHAGPFEVAASEGAEAVDINVTSGVLPGRHLVVLSRGDGAEVGEGSPPRGAQIPSPPATGMPTAREREILDLLAGGATDVRIARRLGLSPATVQTHVRNLKAKLGARTRAQAVAMGLREGLIPRG